MAACGTRPGAGHRAACRGAGLGILCGVWLAFAGADRAVATEPPAGSPAPPAAVAEPAANPPAPAGRPLHEVIDEVVAAAAVGPLAAPCSDADFVRRVHLDLVGVIPPVATVRGFLADPAADKRARLVDSLLADPAFARHMMFLLDAMLLERATPPGDLAASWREYLYAAMAEDRPLDALAREMLESHGGDPATRPAAAFLLARDAEPVQLTRAVGRLFFGRDLACAQCHDHPLDDDIRQAEHQGLHAFLVRTSLFKGKDNVEFVAEKAEGEVDYQSVFTKEGEKGVWPRLPGGPALVAEPRPEPSAAYLNEPSKTSHGVPSFSRRAALASRIAADEGFRRTLANRIWALFLGRGLVHPLDGFGPGNPPVHPRLLAALAQSLADHGFRLAPLVREIVRSATYQRGVEPPGPTDIDPAAVEALIPRLETERLAVEAERTALAAHAAEAQARREASAAATRAVHLERLGLITSRDTASKAAAAAREAVAAAAAPLEAAREASASLAAAAAHAARAAASDENDPALGALAASFAERAAKKAAATEAAAKAHAEKQAALDAAAAALAAARASLDEATARLGLEPLENAEREAVAARRAAVDAGHALARIEARLQLARDLLAHRALSSADPAAAGIAWESIVDRWTAAGQVAPLKPLSPEQLALSVQQATGGLAARQASAAAAIDKTPPEALAKASGPERDEIRAMHVEMRMVKDASALLRSSAELFSDPLTEGFQASVNQALYIGNAPDVLGQLAPSGGNLAAALVSMSDPGAVADEAFVAVLSRPPSDEERDEVAAFLLPRSADRPQAIAELVWALLSSSEFRFNH